MIVTFGRSSSFGSLELCEASYNYSYVLGLESKPYKATTKGSICHKAWEILARAKVAIQNKQKEFDAEDLGILQVKQVQDIEWLVNLSYDYYSQQESHLKWVEKDRKECLQWTNKLLEWQGGIYNPANLDIVCPEAKFDITFTDPWAEYEYIIDNKSIAGFFGIKGTMDLIVRCNDDLYEIIDYKTGRQWNWATDKPKTYKCLQKDIQLRMYHYAVKQMYPHIKNVTVTIFYVNATGPNTVHFSDDDLDKTKEIIKQYYTRIKNISKPKLSKSYKCSTFCWFGKNNYIDNGKDTGMTICSFMEKQMRIKNEEQMMIDYGNISAINSYRDGGGRKNQD